MLGTIATPMTDVRIDLVFARDYECELVDELRGHERRFMIPEDVRAGADGVSVRFAVQCADPWVGTFAFGRFGSAGVTQVLGLPDGRSVCVVSRGAGYIVGAGDPTSAQVVPLAPIIDTRVIVSAGVLVLACHTELMAYDAEGVRWRTERLSWDNLQLTVASDRTICGQHWDVRSEAMQTFVVDLVSGKVRGGIDG